MLALRWIPVALTAAFVVVTAQTNTNAAIKTIVNNLDITMHHFGPTVLRLQANHTLNDATLGKQMQDVGTAFQTARTALSRTAVSVGSTTVTPTNDDISIVYSEVMALLSTSLSGVMRNGAVRNFPQMVATLDPIVANTSLQLNATLPGSLAVVMIMMRDARQFYTAEGFNKTVAALGF
ncbi:hypothetical protein C8F01DRAFT_1026288 [Mycena amicta]|nr:hypothetical protein C8F01DRAFT_1026288 [Mycena amicta]